MNECEYQNSQHFAGRWTKHGRMTWHMCRQGPQSVSCPSSSEIGALQAVLAPSQRRAGRLMGMIPIFLYQCDRLVRRKTKNSAVRGLVQNDQRFNRMEERGKWINMNEQVQPRLTTEDIDGTWIPTSARQKPCDLQRCVSWILAPNVCPCLSSWK